MHRPSSKRSEVLWPGPPKSRGTRRGEGGKPLHASLSRPIRGFTCTRADASMRLAGRRDRGRDDGDRCRARPSWRPRQDPSAREGCATGEYGAPGPLDDRSRCGSEYGRMLARAVDACMDTDRDARHWLPSPAGFAGEGLGMGGRRPAHRIDRSAHEFSLSPACGGEGRGERAARGPPRPTEAHPSSPGFATISWQTKKDRPHQAVLIDPSPNPIPTPRPRPS
jgi:hypothetical protein